MTPERVQELLELVLDPVSLDTPIGEETRASPTSSPT